MIRVQNAGEYDGQRVDEARLVSDTGVEIAFLSWGALARDWRVPAPEGLRPVALGFESFDPYPEHSPHFGAICGRVANRIAGARFTLDGQTHTLPANEGPNCLHGGPEGFSRRVWSMQPDTARNALAFTLVSPDGDSGFPGALTVSATYTLSGNSLELVLEAMPDRPTPVSLVQHHYFNLGTADTVLDHRVRTQASAYSEITGDLLPTGAVLPVADTRYDLRDARTLRDADGTPLDYDINLVLPTRRDPDAPVAIVEGPDGDLTLRIWSDRPALQLYNGVMTDCAAPGIGGRRYGKYSGLCLEDQFYPGALAHPHFPSIIVTPDTPYRHRCVIEIG